MLERAPKVARPLILIVDDTTDTREMYALYLNAMGYAVETAEDGYEAVVKARTLVPDVIVMDLQMPGVDGWAAIRLELVFTFIASDAIRLRTKLMTSPTMGAKWEQPVRNRDRRQLPPA